MFTQYRERLHIKKVIQGNFSSPPQVINWQKEQLGIIGILADASTVETELVQEFLRKMEALGRETYLLAYKADKEFKAPLSFDAFSKKEIDWLWRPKGEKVFNFKKQPFDILINLCQHSCYPLEHIAVSSQAKLKIGALTSYPNNYDLLLATDSLESYINQVNFFLTKFSNGKTIS